MSSASPMREFTIERRRRHESSPENLTVLSPNQGENIAAISTNEILAAIKELRHEMASLRTEAQPLGEVAPAPTEKPGSVDDDSIKLELVELVRSIGKAKSEIAAIKHPMAGNGRLEKASKQLSAIVEATESATNDILKSVEQIETIANDFTASHPADGEAMSLADDIGAQLVNIMEACSFQDITGQRVTKVINIVEFIEERVQAMIKIWGDEAFDQLPVEDEPEDDLLQGPQLADEGISQGDIDALFD